MKTAVGTHVVRARYGYNMARKGEALHRRWGVRSEKSGLSERKMDEAGSSGRDWNRQWSGSRSCFEKDR
jgi:hypothetical protein